MQQGLLVSDVKDQKAKSICRVEKMLNIFLLIGMPHISSSSDKSFLKEAVYYNRKHTTRQKSNLHAIAKFKFKLTVCALGQSNITFDIH